MKSEKLLLAIGEARAEFVEESMPAPKRRLLRWASLAACLAVTAAAGAWYFASAGQQNGGGSGELPMLTLSESTASMGFEGYMAYNFDELAFANPWQEGMQLDTLPVYRNGRVYDPGQAAERDYDGMKERLLDAADRLGLDAADIVITDDVPNEEKQAAIREKFASVGDTVPEGYFDPSRFFFEEGGYSAEVDDQMTVTIRPDQPVTLPDGYRFGTNVSYEDMVKSGNYLLEQYRGLIGMKNPVVGITGGDRDIYADQRYELLYYEDGNTPEEKILGYNFNTMRFYYNDEGQLYLLRSYSQDLSDKVGDYPIISANEAKELLLAGNCATSVPYPLAGEEYIARVELLYRTEPSCAYYLPYYRFLAELPEMGARDGLKHYGAYYVPAVESRYIANMPTYDGNFNGA